MGQQSPRVLSTDPNAGVPLRTAPRILSTDPNAGEPLRMNASKVAERPQPKGWFDRTTGPEDFPVVNMMKGAWNVAKGIPAGVAALAVDLPPRLDADGTVHYPLENTLTGLAAAHANVGAQAREAFTQGDYVTAARKAMNALVPMFGPAFDVSEDKIARGDIAEGIGEIGTNVLLAASGGLRPKSAPVVRGSRVPLNPAEAAAVEFARQEGIPLDAGTATGSQFVKNLQKKAGSSWGGASTVERAQAAQGEALAAAADRLAARANNGGPAVGPVEAGEGVRAALEGKVKGYHAQANRAYSQFRNAEASAPEEMVQARPRPPVAKGISPEQSFMLRWLSDDLAEMQYQPSSRMRGVQQMDEFADRAYGEADTSYAPRVAGTPTQEMFNALGIKGTRAEISTRIDKVLTGQIKDPRLLKLADAFAEAFDGQRFDFDLISDETLTSLGIRRRDFRSPITTPYYDEPGAAAFYPDRATPEAPRMPGGEGDTAMRFAVDLKPHKEALRPLYEKLQKEREITGTLHGDKARAAVALEGLINGPDFAPLSIVESALGPIKKLARVGDIRELRTPGQGVASRVAGELDTAVRGRAEAAGPAVAQSLSEGRAATRMKHATADVMRRLAPAGGEPVSVFRRLTSNKDAGIAKLRELQKHAPDQVPQIARALLEDVFDLPTARGGFTNADGAWARWQKIGGDSKRILFPDPGHVKALNDFFLLAKKVSENPNPSGTAQTLNATNLLAGLPMYGLAKLLYSPAGVRAITGAMEASVSLRPGARVAQAAALAQLSRVAKEAGVTLEFPKAADNGNESAPHGDDETAFRAWYEDMSNRFDLAPDPDSPDQFYDYRAAFRANAKPGPDGHWPSQFKRKGHPNEIVGGFNTRTGEPEPGYEQITDVQKLIELGWDPSTAKQLAAKARRARAQ